MCKCKCMKERASMGEREREREREREYVCQCMKERESECEKEWQSISFYFLLVNDRRKDERKEGAFLMGLIPYKVFRTRFQTRSKTMYIKVADIGTVY